MAGETPAPKVGELVPVACGGEMHFKKNTPWAHYQDQPVAFCSRACLRTFEADPDPFMDGLIAHPED